MAAGHREQIGAIVSFRIIPRAPFCWSEWQDLNLRPPRPERGSSTDNGGGGGMRAAKEQRTVSQIVSLLLEQAADND
jgi:hypothetical protein